MVHLQPHKVFIQQIKSEMIKPVFDSDVSYNVVGSLLGV